MAIASASFPARLSQSRSLLRDIADGLAQQMVFWGCDVRHPHGNLLVKFGMERLARESTQGEGSSRYRMEWQGGIVELHGFCVAWYPPGMEREGAIFVRHRGRLLSTSGEEFHTPGAYDQSRLGLHSPDSLLERVPPFVSWWIAYEEWIAANTSSQYRRACWTEVRRFKKSASWLPPEEALEWLRQFVDDPHQAARARKKPCRT